MDIAPDLVTTLRAAGCVAAEEEAAELTDAADGDTARLSELLGRRVRGEPLAWIVGSVRFCGETVLVDPGVYVPRWQSEPLARRAIECLPNSGTAVDLCSGAGAIAVALMAARPLATVLATELDPLAARCARRNGVSVFDGDLTAPLPSSCLGRVDVVTAVCPYVPTTALGLLPRDVLAYEPLLALDGGPDGTTVLIRAAIESGRCLRVGGTLLLELGGAEAELLAPKLDALGYAPATVGFDEDAEVRFIETVYTGGARR